MNTHTRNNHRPTPDNKTDLKELAREIIDDVAYELMPDRIPFETDKEIRFGTKGSFAVNKREGTFYDHEEKKGGGLLDMVCHLCDFETRHHAADWLREKGFLDNTFTPSQRPRPQVQTRPQTTGDMFKVGQKLWTEATPIPFYQNHPVRRWCLHRELFPGFKEIPPTIRYHEKYKGGCIIVALATVSDFVDSHPEAPEPRQFQLISIDKQGRKQHAFNGDDKRTYGRATEPCVAVFGNPKDAEVSLCEGVADALKIQSETDQTTIATLTTFQKLIRSDPAMSYLASRIVTIFADNDEAGRKSQSAIGNALFERGGDVFVHDNPVAKDPAAAGEV